MGIQTVLLALIALAAGTLAPIQMAANAQLAKGVNGAIAATIIFFTAGWWLLILINSVGFRQFPSVSDIVRTPVHLLLIGGAIGAIFVSANVLVRARLGSAATASLVIAGQPIGALTVDRLGLFDFGFRGLSAGRLVGVALMLAGAMLVRFG